MPSQQSQTSLLSKSVLVLQFQNSILSAIRTRHFTRESQSAPLSSKNVNYYAISAKPIQPQSQYQPQNHNSKSALEAPLKIGNLHATPNRQFEAQSQSAPAIPHQQVSCQVSKFQVGLKTVSAYGRKPNRHFAHKMKSACCTQFPISYLQSKSAIEMPIQT
ncbi:hypothetical protein Nepgr_022887 [Nepenthes gracilis]|uniref:Uncharacterized protein n=1 Tax=Nepenthes gracilis TaxID=150966 RepID=A0AAD3XYK6_NEPGR|nr:hypothetical protein Nepgr_022887 [Nepenthes gracilis]